MLKPHILLLSDTYNQVHDRMYPDGLTQLVSYWTPRKSMFNYIDQMVFFGLQEFVSKYLVEAFNEFFSTDWSIIKREYETYMDTQIGRKNYDIQKIHDLHELGWVPLLIKSLPEGTLVDMGVPCIEITNTHPDFAWLVQWIECILQVELWKMCCHATIGHEYFKVAKYYYDKTTDGADPAMAMADFGMRGMSCLDESVRASASWLLSFNKTSTIPALKYLDYYYGRNKCEEKIGIGAVSTEHSVMGANYAVDGDEITFIKKLLTELYPDTSFSMVSDTYNYWNLVDNLLPQCREEIMNHNGKLLIRPDSGDIVEISVKTVQQLSDMFGGSINEKGYKELDPHIGIIYGDGCTLDRVKEIWRQLEELEFAANCITFGVGAFCFTALNEDGKMVILTRDTFGIAMKATYGVINGKEYFIYKDPKTDTNHLKKSHKGCCRVYREDGQLKCEDELYGLSDDTLLQTVFYDGQIMKWETIEDIRKRLKGECK